jgi:hypothetical protein
MSLRRALCTCLVGSLLAPFAVAEARQPPAGVALQQCRSAQDPSERRATFVGRMMRVPGAHRLQMRFALRQRVRGERRWTRVEVADWDQWHTSDPAMRGYRYAKTVLGLSAPAAYRTVVRFRWVAADGRVVARHRATSRPCRQADVRPNLRVGGIDISPVEGSGLWRYRVLVRNTGRSRAGASVLALMVDGSLSERVIVRGLGPRGARVVDVHAPPCDPAGPGISAIADADDQVAERDETDNVFEQACPGP